MKTGYLWAGDYDSTLEKSYEFLNTCFQFFEMGVTEQWEKGSFEGGFITMNLGISSLIRVFDDLLEYLEKHKRIDFTKLTGEEIAGMIRPYLEPVITFVEGLSIEQIKKLRSFVGGSAVDKVLREFQDQINMEYEEFSPEGLAQWQKESTGIYNRSASQLGHEMQIRIRDFIFDQLKKAYGEADDRWWTEGVHTDVQKKCANERIEKKEVGPDWKYLFLMDYYKIIKHKKKILINLFTPPGLKSAGIDKKLKWFKDWNNIRNKYSHPEQGIVTEEEYQFMLDTKDWLYKNI